MKFLLSISISTLSLQGPSVLFLLHSQSKPKSEKRNDLPITVFHEVDEQCNKPNNNQWTKTSKKYIEHNN